MNTGTQAVLWVSVPLEVRIEKAGSRKVYVSARKVKWALGDSTKAESPKLSASALVDQIEPLRRVVASCERNSNNGFLS